MEILTKRLAYIDAMRGFTMILVVFSHVQYFGYGEFIQSVYNFCGGGVFNILNFKTPFVKIYFED